VSHGVRVDDHISQREGALTHDEQRHRVIARGCARAPGGRWPALAAPRGTRHRTDRRTAGTSRWKC
jgi:hypothetical protein